MPRFPSDDVLKFLSEFYSFRGSIMNSFAQVEFLLGDLVSKCRKFSEYKDLIGKLPYRADSRVKAVKKLCAVDGPLKVYADDLIPIADKLLELEGDRHFFAHGFATCERDPTGAMRIHFRRFDPQKADTWEQKQKYFGRDELHRLRDASAIYAQNTLQTARKIYAALALE